MPRKVLIVTSSLRKKSNSERMAEEAARGAKDAGNTVEVISLKDKEIHFCRGCLACQKSGKCVIRDDMDTMTGKIRDADVLIFATPIYYYELSGQLKTFLDRCNPLYPQEYAFRDVYLLSASAEEGEKVAEKAVSGLKGWTACFPKARFAGSVNGGGATAPGDVEGHAKTLKAAYELGRAIR
ncbi:MAG: flavodoxin family protein [Desulfovibrio sp.]|nr:flavodoxin family protein [Desulfovibrio sp.]